MESGDIHRGNVQCSMVPAEVLTWEFIVQCPVETFTLAKDEDHVHLLFHTIITLDGGKTDF